jgi:hypothetical protein
MLRTLVTTPPGIALVNAARRQDHARWSASGTTIFCIRGSGQACLADHGRCEVLGRMQHGVTNNFALLLPARRPVRALQARLPRAGVQTSLVNAGA